MKISCVSILTLFLVAPGVWAQVKEEVEPYLVAPQILNRTVNITTADFKVVRGKVVAADEEKVVVRQGAGRVELPVTKIQMVNFRRPRRSGKLEFLGNLLGGTGFGFGGAAIGKQAAQSIRGDGQPGRIGPIVGGIAFGFAGGYIGKHLMRRAVQEEVTLTLLPDVAAPAPQTSPPPQPAPVPKRP
jgi:hypothetical protein